MNFDEKYKQIMECISTDVMGNSQPTAGVFSGDNFARGDTRIPMPLIGGIQRRDVFGAKKKKKKRVVKEDFSHYLDTNPECPQCGGETVRCRGYAHGRPCTVFRCERCRIEGTREDLEAQTKERNTRFLGL